MTSGSAENTREKFNPAPYVHKVNGGDYLDTKWRLVWLRDEAPDSQVITELIEVTDTFALFKCVVTRIINGEVRGVATGHGSETIKDFRDYLEKAETKAIGRALAALGYGAQHIEAEREDRVVDAPVQRPTGNQSQGAEPDRTAAAPLAMKPPIDRVKQAILALQREYELSPDDMKAAAGAVKAPAWGAMTLADAEAVRDEIIRRTTRSEMTSTQPELVTAGGAGPLTAGGAGPLSAAGTRPAGSAGDDRHTL